MSSPNPFAPPVAQVRDIGVAGEEFQPVRIFSVKGRIGRLRYLAYAIGSWFGVIVLAFVLGVVSGIAGRDPTPVVWGLIALYLVLNVMFLIQRSHDMDLSGWLSIVAFVPLAGFFWMLKSGTPGPNSFGPPPPPNTLGVKIMAWLLPVSIVLIGVLAALAIPAYQDYLIRARAAQLK